MTIARKAVNKNQVFLIFFSFWEYKVVKLFYLFQCSICYNRELKIYPMK